ncbi:MAG: glycosyltransferase family 2 protein [Pseudomonadota bacterium]
MKPTLTIVVPCYNEEEVLPETTKRLGALLEKLVSQELTAPSSHVLYVDDGSKDRTWELIAAESSHNAQIRGLRLSRNRGHQTALLAGLQQATGDIVVSIDADLQDNPDVIIDMVGQFREGKDVVYGVRAARTSDTFFKRFTAETYYKLLSALGVELVFNHADYRLLSRRALDALLAYPEVNLFIRGIVPTLGFPTSTVEYDRTERFAGTSKYPLGKMLALAVDGVTSFSSVPLRAISLAGIGIFIASCFLVVWVLWVRLVAGNAVPGWASSVLPMYLLGGVQLFCIGVVGEYVAKTYMETKRRPRYFVRETAEMASIRAELKDQ